MVAEVVRIRRLRMGLSQEQLAERSGIAVRTVRGIESGRVISPRSATLRLLARALDLEGSEFEEFCQQGQACDRRVRMGRPTPAQLPL